MPARVKIASPVTLGSITSIKAASVRSEIKSKPSTPAACAKTCNGLPSS